MEGFGESVNFLVMLMDMIDDDESYRMGDRDHCMATVLTWIILPLAVNCRDHASLDPGDGQHFYICGQYSSPTSSKGGHFRNAPEAGGSPFYVYVTEPVECFPLHGTLLIYST